MTENSTTLDAIVIGAGFGGLYALHHLRDQMGLSVRAFDAAGGVGGTWWFNRYPGARVDAPSAPFYGFTFSQELVDEWDWAEKQASGPEVLRYLDHVADRFDLRRDITFDTWIVDARWDDDTQRWTIETDAGEHHSARFLICATGALFVAHMPDYAGIGDFTGDVFHTGRWPHEPVSFEGKRVGVIGTGSSGVQAIPEIAKTAEHVTVFQRTPQYSLPARNRPLTDDEREHCKTEWQHLAESMRRQSGWPWPMETAKAMDFTEEERHERYEELWERGGIHMLINSYRSVLVDPVLNEEVSTFVRAKISETVADPETARKLLPDYHFGTKRIILDNGYFETYNRPNVSLVDLREDPIECFTETSVRTSDGEHPIDMLVLATGFDAVSGSMLKINPKGRGGVPLAERWAERFETYLGMTIAGFPNLFMIHGPTSPGVLYTMPQGGERQLGWIESVIRHLDDGDLGAIEATEAAETKWGDDITSAAERTLFVRTPSWYMGANVPGKPRQFLADLRGSRYFDHLDEVAENGFEGFAFAERR